MISNNKMQPGALFGGHRVTVFPRAIESASAFFEAIIQCRQQLVLPLHGGPIELDEAAKRIQAEIRVALGKFWPGGTLTARSRMTSLQSMSSSLRRS